MNQGFDITTPEGETKLTSADVLFIGIGRSAVCWYRIALPAMFLGCDWMGCDDNLNFMTGIVRGGTQQPNFNDYKIIVWQQPRSSYHLNVIRKLREMGKIVLIDCDDYLEGVRKQKDHDFRGEKHFSSKQMKQWNNTLRSMCDGVIVTTEWLHQKYSQLAPRSWVCKNGLDMGRYHKHRAIHSGINIGWCGATGHYLAFGHVLDAIERVMKEHPEVNFISVGQGFSSELIGKGIEENRVLSIPFTSVELYPNPLTVFDIAVAPARPTNWYRAKSALRYYEAAAVGAVTVGDSSVYSEIIDEGTGLVITSDDEWYDKLKYLVTHPLERMQMQRNAKEFALQNFDMIHRRLQWLNVFDEITEEL